LLSGLPWDDVRLFLVLYRSRTMGEAAAALEVNTSTVSRRLVGLEEALDARLFERGREGLRPTQAGEALLPAAELVEQGVAGFAHAVDGLEREVSGLVRLACPPDVAVVVVLPALPALLARYPGLRIELKADEATVDLNRREADLALRVVRPERGDLVMRRVLAVAWVPAASASLAARLDALEDPAAAPWIGWGPGFGDAPPARWLRALGVEATLATDSLPTQLAAAAAGIGVALLPAPSVAHYGLVPIAGAAWDTLPPRPEMELYLVTHRVLRSVPRVRAVWDALVAALGE
jgi:DNA-binding transcriptional LysR family regulator